jgi:hypothetical protein
MIYVIDLWMLSIYADTKWHLEMLLGNTVKIITLYAAGTQCTAGGSAAVRPA